MDRRYQRYHAGDHKAAEHHRSDQRMLVDHAPAQGVTDQANGAKAHQAPAHQGAIEAGQALQNIGQVGVSGEHAAEDQDRQQHVALHQRAAQDIELRTQGHRVLFHGGGRQVDQQQQCLEHRHPGEDAKGTAPAKRIGDQGAHRDAEDGSADNPETDLGNRPASVVRPDDVHCRFTGQGPKHRQPQSGNQAGHGHHPDIRRQGRQGIGRAEHQ